MPGPDYAGQIGFYEDFPYAWWNDFHRLDDLGTDVLSGLPVDVSIHPTYADITDQLERKITGINLYESQMERLFDGTRQMADAAEVMAQIARRPGTSSSRHSRSNILSRPGSPGRRA